MFLCRKFIGIGRRKKLVCGLMIILVFCLCVRWIHYVSTRVSNELGLAHLRKDRNLSHYMETIHLLTEPKSTACDSLEDVPLVILVTSTFARYEHRDAVRSTWAKHFPTYFILGLSFQAGDVENIFLEASQYNDMIVYDMQEHYQNLTLKTALMLRWTHSRCPSAGFMLKTDDDVVVNPWIMPDVLKENRHAHLIGYKHYKVWAIRDEYEKWYLPSWLFPQDYVPQYLLGAAYIFNGKYTKKILDAALEVPLINLEDIYFSYLVSKSKLGLALTHDPRLSPTHAHHFLTPCLYWPYAVSHDLSSQDIINLWSGIVDLAKDYNNNLEICTFYNKVSWFLSFLYPPASTMLTAQ